MSDILPTSPRIKMRDYPKAPDLEMRVRIMLGRGIFERRSFDRFMRHTRSRDMAIEVGTHVGSWTLGLSRLFGHVIGFEPQPENRAYLQSNLYRASAHNVTVYPFAVVSKLGRDFSISAIGATRNSGQAHLIPRECANGGTIPVKCMRLDDLHLPSALRVGAIKIDVEGMELDVLRSGVDLIKAHMPTILVEINGLCSRYGFTPGEIIDFMHDLGYDEVAHHRCDHIFVPHQPKLSR